MLSIRAKLTLWYLAIAALVLIAFSLGLYFYLSHGLLKIIDTSLRDQADRMARNVIWQERAQAGLLYQSQTDRAGRLASDSLGDEDQTQPGELLLPSNELVLPVQFYIIVGRDGKIYNQGLDAHGHQAPIIPDALDRAQNEWEPQYDETALSESEPVRIITTPATDEDVIFFTRASQSLNDLFMTQSQVLMSLAISNPMAAVVTALAPLRVNTWPASNQDGVFFVVAGQSTKELHQAQKQLLTLLAISCPLALALAGLGGFWIAKNAFKPVERLTRAAERIGRGKLSERVEEPHTKDEIGHLAATFNEMIGKLEQAFQRERQFTAYASHELKTPLAILRGDIEVALRRDRTPEEYKQVLASNLEEIERLTRLTDDLLTLARSDAGEQVLEFEPVRLDQLAEEAHAYITPLARSSSVALEYDAPPSPIIIEGDQKRLKQLLVNLLDNAIKYTPAGGSARLALAVENSSALIQVSDTGRGITSDALPHIFERFYRRGDPRDARASGFGLGLAISKWVVDAHGGSIDVESAPGHGSRFTVRLPLLKDEGGRMRDEKEASNPTSEI
ncbi:MAG TPA: ATP-binding protein [Blastocatellia bacterium]|nr:ATP-binding protein [Blastocatellia bacterium]